MKWVCAAKRISPFFLLLFTLFFGDLAFSQEGSSNIPLQVSCNKTTSLVFPQIIKNIDRGSKDLLVQKVSGAENILQVKGAKENFTETSLTVVTADGKLYVFIVRYATDPSYLNLQVDSSVSVFEKVSGAKRTIYGVRDHNYEMVLRLKGLFIEKGILYYQLELENLSNISYEIDMLRFYIKDNRQSRRTASQELDQTPLFVYGNQGMVGSQSKQIMVVALAKFTIPDKKHFYIQVMEKNGGRHLHLKISNREILRAKIIQAIN